MDQTENKRTESKSTAMAGPDAGWAIMVWVPAAFIAVALKVFFG